MIRQQIVHQQRSATEEQATDAGRVLQRKTCSCGRPVVAGGECAECRKKRLSLQRRAVNQAGPEVAPPIVHEVLRSPGRPLDSNTSKSIGSRFGEEFSQVKLRHGLAKAPLTELAISQPRDQYESEANRVARNVVNKGPWSRNAHEYDFSDIRIHTDEKAAASAHEINAHAYTYGNHIVFGANRYQPTSSEGKRLLAHELVHTIQQTNPTRVIQRYVPCERAAMSLETCPPREHGEIRRARRDPMFVGAVTGPGQIRGLLIGRFAVESSRVKSDLNDNAIWRNFLGQMTAKTHIRWEILGFSDCQGSDAINEPIRDRRASAIFRALPASAQNQVDEAKAAPITDCMADNASEMGRSLNRSAFIRQKSTEFDFEPEVVEGERAEFACGPDVTEQIENALSDIRSVFNGWSSNEKEEACSSLDSTDTGLCAWDIVELHNNAWIHRNYRPECATPGASPPCGSSVQVGDECYYAGSPNYAVFGVMWKLCFNHFASIPDLSGAYRFRKSAMVHLINLYKGTGPIGVSTPSANFAESKQWAEAGFDGWPSGGTPPSGDRSNCAPLCPLPYSGSRFRVNWWPHQFYTGHCGR